MDVAGTLFRRQGQLFRYSQLWGFSSSTEMKSKTSFNVLLTKNLLTIWCVVIVTKRTFEFEVTIVIWVDGSMDSGCLIFWKQEPRCLHISKAIKTGYTVRLPLDPALPGLFLWVNYFPFFPLKPGDLAFHHLLPSSPGCHHAISWHKLLPVCCHQSCYTPGIFSQVALFLFPGTTDNWKDLLRSHSGILLATEHNRRNIVNNYFDKSSSNVWMHSCVCDSECYCSTYGWRKYFLIDFPW